MRNTYLPTLRCLPLAALLAGSLSLSAGERIKMEESDEKAPLPSSALKADQLRNQRSVGPNQTARDSEAEIPYAPAGQPVVVSPKMSDLLDRNKNWIFNSPGDSEDSLNSGFGTKSKSGPGFNDRRKGSIERYFDSIEKAEKPGKKSKKDKSDDGKDGNEFSQPVSPFGSPFDPRFSGLGTTRDFGGSSAADTGSHPFLSNPGFPKLSDPFKPVADRFNDPINSLQDGTRDPLNPTSAAKKRLEFLNETTAPTASLPSPFNRDAATAIDRRTSAYDSAINPMLGVSGVAAPKPQNQPVLMKAQPPVLELPRRKF